MVPVSYCTVLWLILWLGPSGAAVGFGYSRLPGSAQCSFRDLRRCWFHGRCAVRIAHRTSRVSKLEFKMYAGIVVSCCV